MSSKVSYILLLLITCTLWMSSGCLITHQDSLPLVSTDSVTHDHGLDLQVVGVSLLGDMRYKVRFKAQCDGYDVTSVTDIYNVDREVRLSDNYFTTRQSGVYRFKAVFQNSFIDFVEVKVPAMYAYEQHLLLQYFSAIESQDAFLVSAFLYHLQAIQSSKRIHILNYYDELQTAIDFDCQAPLFWISTAYSFFEQYPSVLLGQSRRFNRYQFESCENEVRTQLLQGSILGMDLSSELSELGVEVRLSLLSSIKYATSARMVVVVSENGVEGPNYVEGLLVNAYQHQDVLRAYLTPFGGERIPHGVLARDVGVNFYYAKELPSHWDPQKLWITAFVTTDERDVTKRRMLNVIQVKVGDSKAHDWIKPSAI